MNLHARGQRLINRATADAAGTGVSVTYTRGATSAALTATPCRENADAIAEPVPGARLSDKERDYLILYADLVAAGFNEPTDADEITETINGVATEWGVTKLPNSAAWRWDDVQRTRVRVHTRRKR